MPQGESSASDSELLDACRAGDTAAFAEVWKRHHRAGLVAARNLAPTLDADDLVSEAYLKILELVQRGAGPRGAFRPYLYQTIRTVAADRYRSPEQTSHDLEEIAGATDAGPWQENAFDLSAAAQAYGTLNERWQSVLWYTEVEQMPPREVAAIMGISPNSVSALAIRAREALQSAWVEAHVNRELAEAECAWVLERLQRHQRDRLTARATRQVDAHLAHCKTCQAAAEECRTLNERLALVLASLFLGGGGAAALMGVDSSASAGTASAGPTVATSTTSASVTSAASTTSAAAQTATTTGFLGLSQGATVLSIAAVTAVTVAITATVLVLSSTDGGPANAEGPGSGVEQVDGPKADPSTGVDGREKLTERERTPDPEETLEEKPAIEEPRVSPAPPPVIVPLPPSEPAPPVDPVPPVDPDPDPPIDPIDPIDGDPALSPTNTCRSVGYPAEYVVLEGDAVGAGVIRARITQNGTTVEVSPDFNEVYESSPGVWRWASMVDSIMIVSLTPLSQWGLVDDDIANVLVEVRFIAPDGAYSPWVAVDASTDC